MSKKIKEFSLIKNFFVSLSNGFAGALNFQDDCAYINNGKNDLVITLDTICEGVHFPKNFPPEFVANRLIIPNLSDLASSGATPLYFLMTGNITKKQNEIWYKKFTAQIAKLQKQYGFSLIGGDTVSAKNDDIFLSATFIGEVKKGKGLTRLGAKIGDDIYVSGDIGGGWLGLQEELRTQNSELRTYYTTPTPQIALGQKLIGIANSCTDISDGLIKDLENICSASKVSAEIYKEKIPLVLEDNFFEEQISGGDDYQLIFTAHKNKTKKISDIAKILNVKISKIGKVKSKIKNKVLLLDKTKKTIKLTKKGWEH